MTILFFILVAVVVLLPIYWIMFRIGHEIAESIHNNFKP